MCNKQGYLKRNCPSQDKRGGPSKTHYSPLAAKLVQVEEGDMTEAETLVDKKAQNKGKVMAKLRGMNLEDRDEVIDALISQEGF